MTDYRTDRGGDELCWKCATAFDDEMMGYNN